MRAINLSDNKIEEIEPGSFNNVNVTEIYLDGNLLNALSNKTFAGVNRIQRIGLNRNNLSAIEPGTFAGFASLLHVDLDDNQLTQLDSSVFAGSNNLLTISLKGNPNLSTTSLCPPAATQCQVYY